ncbi:MAG: nucleoid-associated protein [Bacteroidales bacterium]|nr:nucleoid-associated protein [Bacteroidales bacterium]
MTKIGKIKAAVVQRVGNKSNDDGVSFSDSLCQMDGVEEHLLSLINSSFRFDDWKQFFFIDGLELNPTYRFVSKIFNDESCLVKQANNLARHLYEQSIHPNIKIGEFYVVLLESCEIDGVETNAIGLFKSEVMETVLTVKMEKNHLVLSPEMGMSLKKLEKGCIVFNVDKENGYKVTVVDNTSSKIDAHYWADNFLHVRDCNDDYHQTAKLVDMFTGFVQLQKEESAIDSAITAKKTVELLKSEEVLQVDELANRICDSVEQKKAFETYRQAYEEEHGSFNDAVNVVAKAANRKPVAKMNILKLGKDFEVKIINPNADIIAGKDNLKGKNYYTLYY